MEETLFEIFQAGVMTELQLEQHLAAWELNLHLGHGPSQGEQTLLELLTLTFQTSPLVNLAMESQSILRRTLALLNSGNASSTLVGRMVLDLRLAPTT